MDPGAGDRRPVSSLERGAAFLALVVPLVVTLMRSAASSDWRDDVPAVAGLGVLPLGTEGVLDAPLPRRIDAPFYARTGDVGVALLLGAAAIIVIRRRVRRD